MKATSLLAELNDYLGPHQLLTDPADCLAYGYDNSRRQGQPLAVTLPRNHEDVVTITRICQQNSIPLIPRGQGTGTTGATVPTGHNSIILSTQQMNRIIECDSANRLMIVEPGVINQKVQERAAEEGFFWPPDPTSSAVCTIGGNLAYNSAGPRAVKYGTPRENTLALKAVTGSGETIHTGVHTTKGVVGYDLTRLLIGSEGTLATITEATLKLVPLQPSRRTLRAIYRDMHSAASAVANIMAGAVTPCALEFMDSGAIEMIREHSPVALPRQAGALLMIEVDGLDSQLDELAAYITRAASVDGLLEIRLARTQQEVTGLWDTRKALSPALRRVAPGKINEDVVVPVSRMAELVDELGQLSHKHSLQIINFGHAGNGNLHVNLLFDPENKSEAQRAEACLQDLFTLVLSLHGTLSGEHGIGLVKRDWIGRELDAVSLKLMYAIKAQFDPAGILNPGKSLPENITDKNIPL